MADRMRVLIADDSRVMRKIFRGALEAIEFADQDLVEAADGNEAMRVLNESRPQVDLIIADWDLPGLEGPSFHRQVRGGKKEIPILFCIGRDCRLPAMQGLPGAAFLDRPFRDETLQDLVRKLMAEVRAHRLKESSDVLRNVAAAAEVDLPFMLRLPTRLIEQFLGGSTKAKHPAGTALLSPGEVVECLNVLTSGQVELLDGKGKVVQTCMDGDCFGELSFMLNQPSSVGARAKTAIEVASLSRTSLGDLVRREPSMADYLSTLMARRWKSKGTTRITRAESDLMGSLESMPFADVVQLLHVTQKTGVLGLREGDLSGGVYFQGGEVVHAWVSALKGEEAFYRMSSWKKARFGFSQVPRKEPHTIEQPTMTLLMEAMRRQDEADRAASQ
jgi:CRP-like cAMP-binding protein